MKVIFLDLSVSSENIYSAKFRKPATAYGSSRHASILVSVIKPFTEFFLNYGYCEGILLGLVRTTELVCLRLESTIGCYIDSGVKWEMACVSIIFKNREIWRAVTSLISRDRYAIMRHVIHIFYSGHKRRLILQYPYHIRNCLLYDIGEDRALQFRSYGVYRNLLCRHEQRSSDGAFLGEFVALLRFNSMLRCIVLCMFAETFVFNFSFFSASITIIFHVFCRMKMGKRVSTYERSVSSSNCVGLWIFIFFTLLQWEIRRQIDDCKILFKDSK